MLRHGALLLCALMGFLIFSVSAADEVSFEGKVSAVEPSYLPSHVAFQMYTGNGICPAGTWLNWASTDAAQVRGVYATLLTAFVSDKRVRFNMMDGDASCNGTHLHLLDF